MPRDGETERLILCPLRLADAQQIQNLFPHWEIVRYLLNRVPWPYPDDGAARYVRDVALPAIAREMSGRGRCGCGQIRRSSSAASICVAGTMTIEASG